MVLQKQRNFIVLIVAILITAILLSSFFYLSFQNANSGKLQTITIGFFNSESNSLVYIANSLQYFAANGLNVTVRQYNTGAAAATGLINGEVDITGASEFVVASKALENESILILGSYCKTDHFFLVARTDRGINGISDLKGKTIGVPMGTNAEFYLGRFLELNQINRSEVNLYNVVPFVQSPNVIANGTVDAVVVFQPYIDQITNLIGGNTIKWPVQNSQLAYIDAVSTQSWAEAHPETIVRFLKSLIQAESFALNHRDQAISITAKTLNYNDDYIARVWQDYTFSVTLDQSQLVAMQDEAQWLVTNHLSNATVIPSFLNYIYVNGLESIKPEAVNIIR